MKKNLWLILMVLSVSTFAQNFENTLSNGALKVSENKRFLVHENGKPFFWLGDTAWELFHRLNREEAETYLKNRAEKGFTVIQAVALAELDGLHTPNPYGNTPLINDDPTQPNEAYFQHVDYIINKAAELGLYVGLLPTWGDKVFKSTWGKGPEIFTVENARIYGKWIANRYKNHKNIIWINGGDRNPQNESHVAIWRALAKGIEEGIGAEKALITFHPQPTELSEGGSTKWFHQDSWLDFNMFQTGHCRENNVWDKIKVAYDKTPIKPVIDGETIYEDHPVCFNAKDLGISSAYDVRKNAYFDVFAGAFGHTYGCHDIWQFYDKNREGVNTPPRYWQEAMNLAGASQLKFLRQLIESKPMLERVPDQSLITDVRHAHDHIQATRGKNYAFIYSAQGKGFTVNMDKLAGKSFRYRWMNPRDGSIYEAGKFERIPQKTFTSPKMGYGNDWVLIIDEI